MRLTAVDSNDRTFAALAWGGALMTGPLVPGVIWIVSRKNRESLALRFSRQATLFWLAVMLVYVPSVAVALFIPALTADPGADISPPGWFFALFAVLVPTAWIVSIVGVVRAVRAPVQLPAPPVSGSTTPPA